MVCRAFGPAVDVIGGKTLVRIEAASAQIAFFGAAAGAQAVKLRLEV